MTRITRALAVATAVVLLGGVATATYAGTGKSLLLGQQNKAPKTPVLISKPGPALALKGQKGKPPLAVSSSKQIAHLNASLLGGKTAAALGTRAKIFTLRASAAGIHGFVADLPGL